LYGPKLGANPPIYYPVIIRDPEKEEVEILVGMLMSEALVQKPEARIFCEFWFEDNQLKYERLPIHDRPPLERGWKKE
jgi:hypothetical protein